MLEAALQQRAAAAPVTRKPAAAVRRRTLRVQGWAEAPLGSQQTQAVVMQTAVRMRRLGPAARAGVALPARVRGTVVTRAVQTPRHPRQARQLEAQVARAELRQSRVPVAMRAA
jgi:hypothetical protein